MAALFVMIESMGKSLFIEGIDGTGKSGQIKLLAEYLRAQGEEVLVLREPGGSEYYEAIREQIHFKDYTRSPLSDALTCAGGIAENIRLSIAALAHNQWVISDRAYPSNLVYQVGNGLNWEVAERINKIALNDFEYDIKILIDIPVSTAQARLSGIGKKKDRYESLGEPYFERVRADYLKLARQDNYIILDGLLPIDKIHELIKEITNT